MSEPLNRISRRITQPKSQGASQAMLYATGLSEADMDKAQVGIASCWYEGNSCNMHLNDLAAHVKEGVVAAGTRRDALQHDRRLRRHLDGHRGHELLAAVARPDRRLDRDGDGRAVVRRARRDPRLRQEHARLPDRDGAARPPGADGLRRHDQAGQRAARATCSTSSRPSSPTASSSPSASTKRRVATSCDTRVRARAPAAACTPPTRWRRRSRRSACRCRTARRSRPRIPPRSRSAGAPAPRCARLLELDLRPRAILTRKAFENAIAVVCALGGSTNAVLHLDRDGARGSVCRSTIDDFQAISDRVPLLADLKPSGRYVMEDLHRVGGTPAVMKLLLEKGAAARRLHDGHRARRSPRTSRRCRRSRRGRK